MSQRAIHQQAPEHRKDAHRRKLHPLGKGSADQRRSDHKKHHLEYHVHRRRQRAGHRHHLFAINPLGHHTIQQQIIATTNEPAQCATAKRKTVTADRPHDRHQTDQGHTLHQDTQHILFPYQAPIKQCQARCRHQQHQCRTNKHPSRVCLDRRIVQRRWTRVVSDGRSRRHRQQQDQDQPTHSRHVHRLVTPSNQIFPIRPVASAHHRSGSRSQGPVRFGTVGHRDALSTRA